MAHPIYADFTAGEISYQAAGRVETPMYHRACRTIENFIVRVEGGADYRRGSLHVEEVDNNAKVSRLIPWEEPGKLYFLEICEGKIKFYSTATSTLVHTISVSVPWVESELADIWIAFDGAYTMFFTHKNWKAARLVHNSPYGDTDWTLDQPTLTVTNYADTSLFSATGKYASICLFIQTRLALANATLYPNRIWFSNSINQETGDTRYTDFTLNTGGSTKADLGFSLAAYASRGGEIRWLAGKDVLIVGTSAGEVTISGGDQGLSATGLSIIKSPTDYGGSKIAIGVGDSALFLQKGKTRIREMVVGTNLQYAANDLMTLASDVGKPAITSIQLSTVPSNLILATRSDGQIAAMSYERQLQVMAWQRLVTDGSFESVAVGTDSSEVDQIWYIVKRTINGATKRYIERRPPEWSQLKDAIYLDCAKTFDNGAAKTIGNLQVINPITITITGHGLSNGDKIKIEDVVGTTELNGNIYTVKYIDANSFSLRDEPDSTDINGTEFKLTLDVAPTPGDFAPAATLTGTPSGKTNTVISKIDSKTYICYGQGFDAGDSVSDGTNTAACTSPYPLVDWYYSPYVSGGTVQKVQKVLTGLSHLEAKTVKILGDGAVIPPEVVSSGGLTMDEYANLVHVGLGYTGKLLPMPLEAGAYEGTAQGRTKRIERVVMRFKDSIGCKVGPDENNLETLLFREPDAEMGVPTQPYSGDLTVPFPGEDETEGNLLIVQDEPLPLSIVALMPRLVTNE